MVANNTKRCHYLHPRELGMPEALGIGTMMAAQQQPVGREEFVALLQPQSPADRLEPRRSDGEGRRSAIGAVAPTSDFLDGSRTRKPKKNRDFDRSNAAENRGLLHPPQVRLFRFFMFR
jgi:hypothetical protein